MDTFYNSELIDAQKHIDTLKLRFYNEYLYTNHIYDEGDSDYHRELTRKVVQEYIDPLQLPLDSHILDLGCGPGYFLDEMRQRGYTNYTGVTLTAGDIRTCENHGHRVQRHDLSFLPQTEGYYDESVDFIFLRHALEHSPYPVFTLMEYNRVLKQGAKIYIEVPAPDCARGHEFNPNHYSIFGERMLQALLDRAGFTVNKFEELKFTLNIEGQEVLERFFCVMATKTRPLDVK